MNLKKFRYLLALSIIIFMISSIFTGVKGPPIIIEDKMIERGFYEHFIFLIVSSAVLLFFLITTLFLKEPITRKSIKRGLKIVGISVSFMAFISVFCDLSALFATNNLWGDFEFMLFFLLAVPSTVGFLIGFLILIYGWFKSAGDRRIASAGDGPKRAVIGDKET